MTVCAQSISRSLGINRILKGERPSIPPSSLAMTSAFPSFITRTHKMSANALVDEYWTLRAENATYW